MNSRKPITRNATFRARPGRGDQLADALLRAASLVAEAPGCELWLVNRDQAEPDTVRVSEMWSSREQCEAALDLPGVAENVAQVMEHTIGGAEIVDGEPLGGARMIRGLSGATAFSILDAPDLSQDTELLDRYELDRVVEARYVREYLNAVQVGLTHYRLRPGASQGWAHRHGMAEEIYVAISGSGRVIVDERVYDIGSLDAVRVGPGSTRSLEAGPSGLEVLAFGSHVPGDGEMVSGGQSG
jgi:quinol monooxygenase YgiN/mannose-6-phosphate isomerase-like protein (cupin superfamily)